MVQTFIRNKGGTKDFALFFILGGDYLTLRLDAYIELLDNEKDFLSTNAMNFLGYGICTLVHKHGHIHNTPTLLRHCQKLDKIIMTLALGLQPKQRHGKVRAKNETWDSHLHIRGCEGMNSHIPK
jgi:hypothetical protein